MIELIEEEWRQDSKGKDWIDHSEFFESFFQLADVWTPRIDGSAYADFLRKLFRRITVKKGRMKPDARLTKIKPKIIVKVLNKDLRVGWHVPATVRRKLLWNINTLPPIVI